MASVGGDLGASNGGASADTVPAGDEKTDMDMEAEGSGAGKAGDYVRELLNEKQSLDPSQWPNATRLLDQEVTKEVARIQSGGKPTARDSKYVDIYREKPIRVAVKVLVPIKEHPKFNFVGKLLGPKGNSMKRLQEDTMTKMAVLGRGSMKDKQKEEELRLSMDPKYAHLSDDLHVEIAAFAPPAEAHARIAYALAEVRKYLIPDSNDEIRQEQMREMELLIQTVPGGGGGAAGGAGGGGGGGAGRRGGLGGGRGGGGAGAAGGPRAGAGRGGGGGGGGVRGAGGLPPPLARSAAARAGLLTPPGARGLVGLRKPLPPPPPPPPLPPPPPPPQALLPRPTPTKTKVLSILERARAAMEETAFACEDDAAAAGGAAPSTFFESAPYDSYGAATGYLPMAHRYGGYDDYDDSAGDYYDSPDVYAGADDAGSRWKGFKSAASVAAERSRFRAAPYTRPSK
ncbi:hypothetical protein R5R35_002706 [Gryllus longicercus]|uniref:K Homology domain-containing protein n=1 Tax=Gryllus longicercus TaxID=2509291 RepID=A0AAN9VW47_9ORTH